MTRVGLFCFLGRGHLDPGLAIGAGLLARGHRVTVFHLTIAEVAVRRAGLDFVALDHAVPLPAATTEPANRPPHGWRSTTSAVTSHALRTLNEGPTLLRAENVEAVVADQLDVAASTVAEHLGLPCVSLSCAPPLYLDDSVPPAYVGWPAAADETMRARNRRANHLIERTAAPLLELINARRREWRLQPLMRVNDLFSRRGIITQLPAVLELPRVVPDHLVYTAQFRRTLSVPPRFTWERLDGRPLVYASMGTIRNTSASVFRTIAAACAPLPVQLVMSLGGGMLEPRDFEALPGNPIVVHYAPQRALIDRAELVINCGGLNTTLDALFNGLPLVAIPVGEDQPGVAARIAAAGAGIVEPSRSLTVHGLRLAIERILGDAQYRSAAQRVQGHIRDLDGVTQAVGLFEGMVTM